MKWKGFLRRFMTARTVAAGFLLLSLVLACCGCATRAAASPAPADARASAAPGFGGDGPLGQVWIGTQKGLSIIESGRWRSLEAGEGVPGRGVLAVASDKHGNVWVSHQAGLSCLQDGRWKQIEAKTLGYRTPEVLACDAQGKLWAATYQELLVIDDWRIQQQPFSVFGLPEARSVRAIEAAPDGRVWVATDGGVAVFDGANWTSYDESSGLCSKRTTAILVDDAGSVWVGHDAGISVMAKGRWRNSGTAGPRIDDPVAGLSQVKDLALDAQGLLWAVTFGSGVYSYDGRTWKRYSRSNAGLIGGNGRVIACDAAGRAWVGTDFELAVFDGQRWLTYTAATSGLASDGVTSIACLGAGGMELPPPGESVPGSVRGRVVTTEGDPVEGAEVCVCWDVAWPLYSGSTPCTGKVYKARSDDEGRFVISDIPMGVYDLAVKLVTGGTAKWYTGGLGGSSLRVVSGKETYFGELKIKTD